MPVSRMRMRPWLENMINSNTIDGLRWVDEHKTMFSIPWKHAARHGWEIEKDANLFKLWAIHTGKYVEGQTCDPKTWKANFRCAMNSLPDITEVKNMSVNKGHQAVRIYKMLPLAPKSKDKRCKAKEGHRKKSIAIKTPEDTEDSSDTQFSTDDLMPGSLSPQENTVDSTVNTEQQDERYDPQEGVPDFSLSIEIDHFDPYQRFEVSPDYSPDYNIIKICEQLEKDTWLTNSSYDSSFLINESCTSPGSQCSDCSSGEDVDIPQYTNLGTGFSNDFWKDLSSHFP